MEHPKKLGKYEILDVLGEGAMGIVYRGFDPGIRRTVALKTIRVPHEDESMVAELAARFRNEARAAGRLNHPGIVNVYDYGEEGGTAYIAMEFVEGQTLAQYLAQKVRFKEDDIVGLMSQLLDALHHAHEAGVCHRDVKPANIILRPHGQLKVADFGIARLDAGTLTRMMPEMGTMGTPAYMAPEQFTDAHPVDRRVDVYAAGVTLYLLLTGRLPFIGSTEQLMYKVVHTSAPPPSTMPGVTCPSYYDELLAVAMAKAPQDRFANAIEFKRAVERAFENASGKPADPIAWGQTIVDALITQPGTRKLVPGAEDGSAALKVVPAARHTVLIVDDTPANLALLSEVLRDDYRTLVATSGERALQIVAAGDAPDLILLDVVMPQLSGYEVCARLKQNPDTRDIPVIFVSAQHEVEDETRGLELGGVDFLAKPISPAIVKARVRTHLLLSRQRRQLQRAVHQLEAQAGELAAWNLLLEQRVAEQVTQVNKLQRLRRYFSPSVADLILGGASDDPLRHHRTEIVVAFLDLRGFTAFTESSDPEEVMGVLGEFHAAMGAVIVAHNGTLERFAGDGLMVFINDPMPVPEPALAGVRMALEMRERFDVLLQSWTRRGYTLEMGIGIAQGFATIGAIGFEGRRDYGAIGNVTNLAARLCGEARGGQTLVSQKVFSQVAALVRCEAIGELQLKGFARPVPAFNVLGRQPAATAVAV